MHSNFCNGYYLTVKPIFLFKAKPFALGTGVGLDPQRHNIALPIPTCWYLNTLKFALPPTQILKFALPPMRNPNGSQWNIGCFQTQNVCVGHVYFMLFVSTSFALGSQRKCSFQWNMGLTLQGSNSYST